MLPWIMSSWFIQVDFLSPFIPPFHQLNLYMAKSSQSLHSACHAQWVTAKRTGRTSAVESSQNL